MSSGNAAPERCGRRIDAIPICAEQRDDYFMATISAIALRRAAAREFTC
jgi:hypothetical protein